MHRYSFFFSYYDEIVLFVTISFSNFTKNRAKVKSRQYKVKVTLQIP